MERIASAALSINEVFASATGVAYATYRFLITMSDALLARCGDLLVDGQRVAAPGPITLEVTYDARFQTDAFDAGLRTWTVQMDVLDVCAVGDVNRRESGTELRPALLCYTCKQILNIRRDFAARPLR